MVVSATLSETARRLGRRGGLARARRLSSDRRAQIAKLGAIARIDSLRLAKAIRLNFSYVMAMRELHPPPAVRSTSTFRGRLPGIY